MGKRILVIGNSVAIRVRPADTPERNYADLLEQEFGHDVENLSEPASMIGDSIDQPQIVSERAPDVLVVHYGINEACTRSVSRRMYKRLQRPIDEVPPVYRPVSLVARKVESELRSTLVRLRGKRAWMATREFETRYATLLSKIPTEVSTICIGINPPSDRIESHLPGTQQNAPIYDKVIRDVSERYGASYINPSAVVTPEMTPDGIHFNADGHARMAAAIDALVAE